MRPFQVFAAMSPERAEDFFSGLAEKNPTTFQQAVHAAAAALKSRPRTLLKQPFDRRAAAVRRALSRVSASAVAEEMLAVYFLECRKDVLVEWLDQVEIPHEEGALKEDAPSQPEAGALRAAIETFLAKGDDPDRALLLEAFAAQSAVDWPDLDAYLQAART